MNHKIIIVIFSCALLVGAGLSSYRAHSDNHPTKFDKAIAVVLKHEGGLTNDANDPGGITNWGISLRFIKASHLDINGDGKINEEDIIQLTQTEADNIYLKQFWDKYHLQDINSSIVATKLFDGLVNMGASQIAILSKRAINDITGNNLPITGKFDNILIEEINSLEPSVFLDALRHREARFYLALVKKHPALSIFINGWLRRANDI